MSTVFIGLPVYNGENFLETALQSLVDQTYTDFHVLISDNASTDRTEKICRRFAENDHRITYYRQEKNLGAAGNFNFCVERAHGTYFKWMAHDDGCEPEYLERCVHILEQDAGAVLVQARAKCIDDTGAVTGSYTREWNFNSPDPVTRFSRAMALNHSCLTVFGVMRLDVLKNTPAIAPFVGSDRALLAELALNGRLEYVPDELFLWRDHKNRSVRITSRKHLATWFDSSTNSVIPTLYAQQFWAHQKAISRTELPLKSKVKAVVMTFRWAVQYHKIWIRDLRSLGGLILRRRTS